MRTLIPKITAVLTACWAAMIIFAVTNGWLWLALSAVASVTLIADEVRRHWRVPAAPASRLAGSPSQGAMPGDPLLWCMLCGKRDIACRCPGPWQRTADPRSIVVSCRHDGAVEVRQAPVPAVGVTDDVVAHYCPRCDRQLPADWAPRPACRWCGNGHAGDCQASQRASQFLAGVEQLGKTMRAAGVPAGRPRHLGDILAGLRRDLDMADTGAEREVIRLKMAVAERLRSGEPVVLGQDGPGVVWIGEGETREQIEAAGFHAVEVTTISDRDRKYVRGPRHD